MSENPRGSRSCTLQGFAICLLIASPCDACKQNAMRAPEDTKSGNGHGESNIHYINVHSKLRSYDEPMEIESPIMNYVRLLVGSSLMASQLPMPNWLTPAIKLPSSTSVQARYSLIRFTGTSSRSFLKRSFKSGNSIELEMSKR